MKLIDGIVLTELGDSIVAVPTGKAEDSFRGVIRLNSTGADIFRGLQNGLGEEEIAAKLTEEYEGVDMPTALRCVKEMIEKLRREGLLIE